MVDLAAAVSSALLINESQWIGIIVRPINYSLKDAVLHIDTGPGLIIEESHVIEMESYADLSNGSPDKGSNGALENGSTVNKDFEQLTLRDGRIQFPDWASNVASILWIPVCAISDKLARGSSSGSDIIVQFLRWFHICHIFNLYTDAHRQKHAYIKTYLVDNCLPVYGTFSMSSCSPENEHCGWNEDCGP